MYLPGPLVGPLLLLALGCRPSPAPAPGDSPADSATAEALECPPGEVADGDRCVPEACGQGTWGAVDGGAWFVAAGATGGDGSAEAPFGSIREALAAGATGRVVLAEGEYSEQITLGAAQDGVEIVGRCVELVSWTAPRGGADGILGVDGPADASFAVEGVRLYGYDVGVVHRGGSLRLQGVHVEDLVGPAIDVLGDDATLILEDAAIRRVESGRGDLVGFGLRLQYGARAELARVEIAEVTEEGVAVEEDGVLSGEDLSILDVIEGGDREEARSLWIGQGAEVTLTRLHTRGGQEGVRLEGGTVHLVDSLLEGHTLAAVLNHTGTVELDDTDILGPFAESASAYGVDQLDGGTLEWTGGSATGTGKAAVYAVGGGLVRLDGLRIASTSGEDRSSGVGLLVSDGTSLEATGLVIEDVLGAGVVFEGGDGGDLIVDSTSVRGVRKWSTGAGGLGLQVGAAAGATVSDLDIDGAEGAGVWLSGGQTTLTRVRVVGDAGTLPDGTQAGLILADGAQAQLTDVEVSDVAGPGWQLDEGSAVVAERGFVTGASRAVTSFGGSVTWTGGSVTGNAGLGIYAEGEGALLDLEEVEVGATSLDAEGGGGFGVGGSQGAEVRLRDVRVLGSTGRGIVLDEVVATLLDVTVTETGPWDGEWSYGVGFREGTSGSAVGLVVDGASTTGVYVSAAGAEDAPIRLEGVEIGGVEAAVDGGPGFGIVAREGSHLEVVDAEVAEVEGPGLLVRDSVAGCTSCRIDGVREAGVAVLDGVLRLSEAEVTGVAAISDSRGGIGVYVGAASEGEAAALELVDSTVSGADGAAVYLGGPGAYHLAGGSLSPGSGDEGAWPSGHALVLVAQPSLWDGASGLVVEGVTLGASSTATALLHGATASFSGDSWAPAALQLVQQSCGDGLPPPEGLDTDGVTTTELCLGEDHWFVPLDLDYDPLP